MKKFLNLFFATMAMMMVTMSFTSCSDCGDLDDDYGQTVDKRWYHNGIVGTWVLVTENGYADFNEDGLYEFFDVDITGGNEIFNSGEYKTVLVFHANRTVDIVPYNSRRGTYEFNKAHRCNYNINLDYLRIYDGRHYDNTYTIEIFKERSLELKRVDKGQMVVYKFEYVYQY